MVAVEEAQERTLRHGGRYVAQLPQPIEPELPHAREVLLPHRRPHQDVRQDRCAAIGESGERGQRERGSVGRHVDVELCPDRRERLRDIDGRHRAGALVQHVGCDRRESLLALRIGARTIRDLENERHDGHRAMLDGPHLEAVRERVPDDRWESKWRVETQVGQAAAIDRHQDTATPLEPESAIAASPFGTTLSVTRASKRR